ncbi:MAG: glycosylase, partial [Candidatus Marinimicrobia bacterium]|nr:glycosylase [Candidatus Neomarinimicrobiota bacterium]
MKDLINTHLKTISLPKLPWEKKPKGCADIIWRYSRNPIISWNPIPKAARIYNSAVSIFHNQYIGIFRADQKNGRANLFCGNSQDGLKWEIGLDPISWVDENGNQNPISYGYDPRLVQLDDTFYIIWCDDFHGASIGLGKTKDFKTFTRLSNPLLPFNRNGVLFPRKINGKYLLLSRPSDSGHTPFGDIFISESPDLIHWGNHKYVMGKGGQGWWQGVKIGAGPIPIETEEGWLLFYHGVSGTC